MKYIIDIINEKDNTNTILIYYPEFLNVKLCNIYLQILENMKDFKSGFINGRQIKRQQKWYNQNKKNFHSDWDFERWQNHEYEEWLSQLQLYVCNRLNSELSDIYKQYNLQFLDFNSVLINKYRDGNDFIRPHKDSEIIFGDNPSIVSLSFGDTREFIFKRVFKNNLKENKKEKYLNKKFTLKNGSLLIMCGSSQKYFSHEILKTDSKKPRYNLTFRHHI